ncbi:nuclear pore complex protein DDB_G0274915-like [Palaemon carinicauda]|uniref:nuclear pore complex protein DDB_G0274915-like n=1 Tax=Palaemon carinicauda TaxID=392227 RepID=UPI0035B5B355
MKVLAVLCLLGLVAAKPQLILPYNAPLLTPTIKTDGGVISTYTAMYPKEGFPSIRAALPYNFGYYPYSIPTILAAKPAEDTTGRQKRSADPELAIKAISTPASTTTLATIPTALNYQYTGLPAAVSTIPYTGVSPIVGAYPFTTGLTPYTTGLGPYTANWPFVQPFVGTVKVEAPKEEGVTRAKRSADPELAIKAISTPASTTTLATIPTALNYQYTGLPAAVSTIPHTGVSPIVGTYPFSTNLTPYTTGLGPYTTNWPFVQPFVGTVKVEAPKEEGVTRAKRSADPEADPQLLTTTTGVTGFTYPAVNTGTVVPSSYTYQNLPIQYPTTTTYTAGFPFRTLPINTVYG